MSSEVPDFIFGLDGGLLVPQPLATGPWYEGSMHGSAMLALLARAIEMHPNEREMQVTRFTVDMMRAAPMTPVATPTVSHHAGRSSEVIEARIEVDGRVFARASALRLRQKPIDTAGTSAHYGSGLALPAPVPGLEGSFLPDLPEPQPPAFHQAVDFQPVHGAERPAVWFRMRLPLVEGEALTPFVRAAVTSDWTYSVSFISESFRNGGMPPDRSFSAINPDTALNLHRPLQGEWIALDAQIHYGPLGAGTALAFMHDAHGPIGHSSQAILLRGPEKLAQSVAQRRRAAAQPRARAREEADGASGGATGGENG
jgi:hypothetical protein